MEDKLKYIFDEKKFESTFIQGEKLIHSRKKIKCFPYITKKEESINDFDNVTGMYLCNLENKKPKKITIEDILDKIITSVIFKNEKDKEIFKEVIKKLYFDSNGNIIKNNLYTIKQGSYKETFLNKKTEKNRDNIEINKIQGVENKIASFLSCVLGDHKKIREILDNLEENINSYNICERLLINIIKDNMETANNNIYFTKIFKGLDKVYCEDFKYIIESPELTKEYLQLLLEFYYFAYTAQTSLQLNRMEYGDREKIIPIYFTLEWEKTSKSRKCYSCGWSHLHKCTEEIFAHVNTLELLNQVKSFEGDSNYFFDYINLKELAEKSEENDLFIANQIFKIKDTYKIYLELLDEGLDLKITESNISLKTIKNYRELFKIVKKQFIETGRHKPYVEYPFELIEFYKNKFYKNRGRNGGVLNLSEEIIIFLTKISIKNKDKMRLIDVFKEFENRGVFLDEKSKEKLDLYYEGLNLIEKKSDSGDAKYVKRIL